MDPKISNKLMESIPEMQEFVSFLKGEVRKLDSLSDIKMGTAEEIAIQVHGKSKAIEILLNILSPLINTQDISGSDKDDYNVV